MVYRGVWPVRDSAARTARCARVERGTDVSTAAAGYFALLLLQTSRQTSVVASPPPRTQLALVSPLGVRALPQICGGDHQHEHELQMPHCAEYQYITALTELLENFLPVKQFILSETDLGLLQVKK